MMRSGRIPSRIHQIERRESPPGASVENGGPLSVRMARGSPYSLNADSKTRLAYCDNGRRGPLQRQGMAALAAYTANREAAFEVCAPDCVRCDVLTQTIGVRRAASNPPTWANESLALQDVADRKLDPRSLPLQHHSDLAGTPARVSTTDRDDRLHDVGRDCVRMSVRR